MDAKADDIRSSCSALIGKLTPLLEGIRGG